MAADGWQIDQYAVTTEEYGIKHHIIWRKD
jgi:hypothetical protein